MSDKSDIAQTPEAVALLLMHKVEARENKPADRKGILDLYAECLEATTGRRAKP